MSGPSTPVAGLPCPRCRVDLVMSERQGIEIDYCPNCRGVWLDRGELDKIIERNAQFAAAPERDAPAPGQPAQSPWTAPIAGPPPGSPPPGYPPAGAPPPPGWGQAYPPQPGYGGHGYGHDSGKYGGTHGKRRKSFLSELFD